MEECITSPVFYNVAQGQFSSWAWYPYLFLHKNRLNYFCDQHLLLLWKSMIDMFASFINNEKLIIIFIRCRPKIKQV